MPNIDIKVDADLNQLFQLPACADITLPKAENISVQLPTGGTLKSFADISKGIPTDCSMTFSLMMQIAPFLGSLTCLLKVLKLLKPLIDVVQGLPMPPVKALSDFAEAAAGLAPCLLVPTPASIIPFILDLLCLILKVLKCFVDQMKSLINILKTLASPLNLAMQTGNNELLSTLQCAQQNAQTQAGQIMDSLGPVGVLLELAGPLFEIAGVKGIAMPALGPSTDVSALESVVQTIENLVGDVQMVIDGLGGCPS